MKKIELFAVLLGGVLLMTGCVEQGSKVEEPSSAVIASAKKTTQDEVRRVAEMAPGALIERLDQSPTGSLVSCSGGRQWAGHATLMLGPDAEAASVIDDIESTAAQRTWTASRDTSGGGKSRLTLRSDIDVTILIRPEEGPSVNMASFSECFTLPDDFVPARSY